MWKLKWKYEQINNKSHVKYANKFEGRHGGRIIIQQNDLMLMDYNINIKNNVLSECIL